MVTIHLGAMKTKLVLCFLWTSSVQDFLVCYVFGTKKVAGKEMKEIKK